MTKILHITTDSNIGGAGHQILALIGQMDASEYSIEVILPENARLSPLLAQKSIPFTEVPHIAERSFSIKGLRVLYKTIKACAPDIVHTHGSLAGRIAAWAFRRSRIVYTRHSAFTLPAWRLRFPVKQLSGIINNSFSDLIIAVSPAAKDNLLEMGTAENKIRVVYNGLPAIKLPTVNLQDKYNVPPDTFTLIMLTRLAEVKGHDDVLDAAKMLPPDVLILIGGMGPREAHLEERIRNENITNVKLLGFIDEIEEVISIADAQLNASFGTEATSLALIQGMSAGRPAIVTNFGGNPYVIQDGVNGLVVETRNPQAMAEAIIRLKSDRELYTTLSTGALQIYQEKFTDKIMASGTEAVYKGLLTKFPLRP